MRMSCFPLYSCTKKKEEVKLDLSNYATKATGADTSQFANTGDLADLNSEVDKLDFDKLSELDADKFKSTMQ